MKILVLVSLITVTVCYDDVYDKLNYDTFRKNVPLLKRHLNCCLGKAECLDPESMSVKPHLVEVFGDACRECTPLQKHHGRQFMKALRDFLPEGYEQMKKKYDIDGRHWALYEDEVNKF